MEHKAAMAASEGGAVARPVGERRWCRRRRRRGGEGRALGWIWERRRSREEGGKRERGKRGVAVGLGVDKGGFGPFSFFFSSHVLELARFEQGRGR